MKITRRCLVGIYDPEKYPHLACTNYVARGVDDETEDPGLYVKIMGKHGSHGQIVKVTVEIEEPTT